MNVKIEQKNILFTAFVGTSAELLIKDIDEHKTLFLPNDKIKDSEKLIKMISNEKYGYVISFGQRPNIKNKVHIETTSKRGEISIDTEFDCEKLKCLFEKNGITAKISHNAGTSFCNELYYNGLKNIYENGLNTKMVFVHIPFEKNIDNFTDFKRKVLQTIGGMDV